jgi:hypothetical protein
MVMMAIVAVLIGIAVQFFQGWELLSFMLTLAVLGGLISGSRDYNQRDWQILDQSYKTAIEWLLLIILFAYVFIEISRWLPIGESVAFLNGLWPGFLIALMCLLMGIAGLRKRPA